MKCVWPLVLYTTQKLYIYQPIGCLQRSSPKDMETFSSSFLSPSPSLALSKLHKPLSSRFTISAIQTQETKQTQKQQQQQQQHITLPTTPPRNTNNVKNKTRTRVLDISTNSPPPPPPQQNVAVTICNALDDLINNFIDPPLLRPSVDPRHVLASNFSPVQELPPTPCHVITGSIPPSLAGGAYIRNGPNPRHLPRGPHHLFDGDGMLHSLLLPTSPSAPATLCSRFVQTYKYTTELAAGGPVLPNVFAFHGVGGFARGAVTAARVLTGQMNPMQGIGLANTSLAYFGNRIHALGESDLPYEMLLSPITGDLTTVGRCDFDGKLVMGMTAHPKIDPVTGEAFAFRYGPVPPFVTYFRFDAAGNKGPDVPIFSATSPSFIHDFAITENYAIFPDIQMVMQPLEMVIGSGSPVGSDHGKVPRLGVLPRYATTEAEMKWFDVPGFNIMHAVNAWEEEDGDVIVMVAPNVLSIEHALERTELVHSCVEMVRIELRTGTVSRTPMSAGNLDFGVMNPKFVGRRNRFCYMGIGDPMPKISGVSKLDFERVGRGDCEVARREFGDGCFGGEPFFVAAEERGSGDEDDGYLVSYVHDERRDESWFVVMDAESPELEIVAEVALPTRVPYGFHGLFVSREQLRTQRRMGPR